MYLWCNSSLSLSLFVQVGLFRKSGVKSRIQALRQMNEASGADGGGVSYEGQSAYDVADMLKQYFRDLPEPLLTSKLSETFLQIYQCKNPDTETYMQPHLWEDCAQGSIWGFCFRAADASLSWSKNLWNSKENKQDECRKYLWYDGMYKPYYWLITLWLTAGMGTLTGSGIWWL